MATPKRILVVKLADTGSPCIYRDFQLGRLKGCQKPECINKIRPEIVLASAERLLQG